MCHSHWAIYWSSRKNEENCQRPTAPLTAKNGSHSRLRRRLRPPKRCQSNKIGPKGSAPSPPTPHSISTLRTVENDQGSSRRRSDAVGVHSALVSLLSFRIHSHTALELEVIAQCPEAATSVPREVVLRGPFALDLALPNLAANDQRSRCENVFAAAPCES